MAAKKKAKEVPVEAETGVPDVSEQPKVEARIKEPPSIAVAVEKLMSDMNRIMDDERFPQEMMVDMLSARSIVKVLAFKCLTK